MSQLLQIVKNPVIFSACGCKMMVLPDDIATSGRTVYNHLNDSLLYNNIVSIVYADVVQFVCVSLGPAM